MPDTDATNTQSQAHSHARGCFVCQTAIPLAQKLWSEATRDHFRNSRVEFLKGLRSLIDDRIEYLSRQSETKGTHVTVE